MRKAAAVLLLFFPGIAFSQSENREQFNVLDLNGDGTVSLAEAAGHAAVVVRFDRADRDRDGKLTLAEFDRLKKLRIRVNEKALARRNAGVGASGRR
jgi:Ca2+-binding EF-hand superfamily protein